jgi:FG-GAP-like repeat/Salmonella virulence plasmid 65kDa B protein
MKRALATVALAALVQPALAQAPAAGFTPGSFRVTEMGAAEYRIPIQVPPGIGGIEPKLALVYNSQAGSWLLGAGWNLEGMSSITRCPRTLAQDGVRGGINYDWNDRYCLEGQRLVAISGGYGADGTEYRTERESFFKVISYGAAGNGPAWFKVWTKGGQIFEYGNTADARIEVSGTSTVRTWAANRVSDAKGNDLAVSYTENSPIGDFVPARIDYAGNSVQLFYQSRPDVLYRYEAGMTTERRTRLASIKTYAGAALVTDYRLEYDNNGANGRSLLKKATECAASGACLAENVFQYQASGNGSLSYRGTPTPYSAWHSPAVGDFNGDGKSDYLINTTNGGWQVWFSNGDGTFTNRGTPAPSEWYSVTLGDFNGDGKTDFLINTGGSWRVYFSNGDGTFTHAGSPSPYPSWHSMTVGDFNGDGLSDFIVNTTASWQVWFSRGDGTFNYRGDLSPYAAWYSPRVGDFDGDGKSDILINQTQGWDLWTSRGDGGFAYRGTVFPYSAWHSVTVADYEGGGKSGLIVNTTNGGWQAYFANPLNAAPADALLAVTSGASTTSIVYEPLTKASVYSKDASAVFPSLDLQSPVHVVASSTQSSGAGGTVVRTYRYGGLKAELGTGRGSLGFRWQEATEPSSGVKLRRENRQDWPYTGLPSLVRRTQSSSAVLGETANTYGCANPATGSACAVASGNRYFPFVSQSVELGNDVNGTALPVVTTSTTYDGYGNATSVTVSTGDGYGRTTTNTYTNDPANWFLGRLTRSVVQSTAP